MNVSTLSQKGDAYEKLYQKGYKVIDFCNIKVNGKYSEGGKHIRVEFPVSGIKNGGQILIKHLRSNGKIQITNTVPKSLSGILSYVIIIQ